MSTQSTEQRIAAAFAARAGEITMSRSALQERLTELQDRGAQQRGRRRWGTVAGAGGLAVAAAAAAVFAAGALDGGRQEASPADRLQAELGEPYVRGEEFPEVGTTYSVEDSPVSFTFAVPELGDVPGLWRAEASGGFNVGLDGSQVTDFASVSVEVVDRAYDPSGPWTEQDVLVEAPQTAAAWEAWLEESGLATVTGREETTVGGLPAERVAFRTADDMPEEYRGCFPGRPCLAVRPIGPGVVGSGPQAGFGPGSVGEITVVEVDGEPVVLTATGAAASVDRWLPLLRDVVDSLRFG